MRACSAPTTSRRPAMAEARQVADEIDTLPAAPVVQPADCAIVFDYESAWAWAVQPQGSGFSHLQTALAQYRQLQKARPRRRHPAAGYDRLFRLQAGLRADAVRVDADAGRGAVALRRAGGHRPAQRLEDGGLPHPGRPAAGLSLAAPRREGGAGRDARRQSSDAGQGRRPCRQMARQDRDQGDCAHGEPRRLAGARPPAALLLSRRAARRRSAAHASRGDLRSSPA